MGCVLVAAPGRVHVRGLQEKSIGCWEEASAVLQQGTANRTVAGTALNADSSRSHSVFTIHIWRQDEYGEEQLHSRLNIVDLAGSERQSRTGGQGLRVTVSRFVH